MVKRFLRDNPIHKKIAPKLDHLFLLRPTLFFAVWVMVVIGMSSAQLNLIYNPLWITSINIQSSLMFLGITLICGSTFIINQIADEKSDQINDKLFLVGRKISVENAEKLYKQLAVLGLLLMLLGDWKTVPLGLIIFFLWGIVYNNSPYKWKHHPVMGILTNMIVGILLFIIGWIHVIGESLKFVGMSIAMVPYILSFTAVSLMTNIPDLLGDREVNANTFAVQFGRRTTSLVSTAMVFGAFFVANELHDPIASTATIVSMPFFLFALLRNLDKDILRAIRYPIFLLNFFVMTIYPWLFPAVFLIYYISKYYYWHRFDLHYPTFLVENN